jgi:protein-S-isoprenylcysteine O-methyltransferase Ste14
MASSSHGFPVPPPALALAAAVAQRAVSPDPSFSRLRLAGAGTLAVAAAALALSGSRAFGRRGTTVNPLTLGRSTALVTEGPFARTRNPMYVGMAGVLLANALARGSSRALLPVAAFVTVIDRLQIPPEEASMAQLFGDEFAAYRARVPRWLVRRG